jgi:hypothetical protein
MFDISVLPVEDKWGLFIDDSLIGLSKARFDADFAAQVLEKKIQQVLDFDAPGGTNERTKESKSSSQYRQAE